VGEHAPPEQDEEALAAAASHLAEREELAKKVQTIISDEVNSLGYT